MNDRISLVQIRVAGHADLPAVLDLYRRSGLDREDGMHPDEAGVVFSRFADYPCYRLYVACIEEAVVGTFALLIMDNLAHGGAPSGIVEDVAVDPQVQGKGVGAAMMRYAREVCREKGCYKLVLSSNKVRKDAHDFYKTIGFEKHGYSFRVQP